MNAQRDHIFISYADEDAHVAEWLARKLMIAGYAVWIDRFKILGGDIWTDNIDDAIKNRTFRMVHLLSKNSLNKRNPQKERQLALIISKERNENFLIPLNLDGIAPKELSWQLSDIHYISFTDWAKGLEQLLKTLEAANCPRPLLDTGHELAIKSCFPIKVIKNKPEKLYTNCYKVLHVPKLIQRWKCKGQFSWQDAELISRSRWACYRVNNSIVLAFDVPPDDLRQKYQFYKDGTICWINSKKIENIDSSNIVKSLVRKSLFCKAAQKRLNFNPINKYWYFTPSTLNGRANFNFINYEGKRTYVKLYGKRKIGKEIIRYYLAFKVFIRDDILDTLSFQIAIRLHLQDQNGNDIETSKVISRRKAIARNWWNHEWFSRQQAIITFLADDKDKFSWGTSAETAVIFSAIPYSKEVSYSLDEKCLDSFDQ